MPILNKPKASKPNITSKRTITTNRATVNSTAAKKPASSTGSSTTHPKPVGTGAHPKMASSQTGGRPTPRPAARPAAARPAVKPVARPPTASRKSIVGGVVVTKNAMIKKVKPEQVAGGAGNNKLFRTAFRKPVDENKETPAYTQIRTDKPPVCYYAKQGPREYMEDTYQIMHFEIQIGAGPKKSGTFYGVFDGHGGKDVSYECVHMTRGLFPYLIEKIKKNGIQNIRSLLMNAFLEYDKLLFGKDLNAGSTAIVVLHFNGKMYLTNLGDSRGMIFTKDELIAVSDDHKPQKPRERTRIYKAGHFVNPFRIFDSRPTGKRFTIGDVYTDKGAGKQFIYLGGNWEPITGEELKQIQDMTKDAQEDTTRVSNSLALSRAFGDFYLKVDAQNKYMGPNAAVSMIPDVTEIDMKKYHGKEVYIFLASDGFWDVNRNTTTLRKIMTEHSEPQKLCQEMVDSSYEKGSQDNTTVVLDRVMV